MFRVLTNNPFALKGNLLSSLRSRLKKDERVIAENDWHARRRPIGCGLTIHPAVGCPLQCSYCYIYDMGFSPYAVPYSLSGLQLIYALLSNRYFIPSRWGTYLAFGSVTEPLLPNVVGKTLEYLESICEYLGNPCQISTKLVISRELIDKLLGIKNLKLSILITVTSLRQFRYLEDKAPDPYRRIEAIRALNKSGFKVFIFLRPLLPGLTLDEVDEITSLAKEVGACGIVVGNFRLSRGIIERMVKKGFKIEDLKRVIDVNLIKKGFIDVRVNGELLSNIRKIVLSKGLIFLKRACCANTVSQYLSGLSDAICPSLCFLHKDACDPSCPSRCALKAVGEPKHVDVNSVIKSVLNREDYKVNVNKHVIELKVYGKVDDVKQATFILSYLLRRRVIIRSVG